MAKKGETKGGNFVAEWFGHRIYPKLVSNPQSIADQTTERCPFLSSVKDETTKCIKSASSRGVCTVSAVSNGPRQDWVVCPYRIFDPSIIHEVALRLFPVVGQAALHTHAGPTLIEPDVQASIKASLANGDRVLVYFDAKIGGEVSLRATSKSPEMAFDVTFVELTAQAEGLQLGEFGILEIQTMDFHGSYRHAVSKLTSAVSLFPQTYPQELSKHPEWTGEGVEGPNIANVVKRTFYQMFFKFGFGLNDRCAGTALIIPAAVWDSWQPFLAGPPLLEEPDGTYRLTKPNESFPTGKVPAWICVIELEADEPVTPNRIVTTKVIGVTADAIAHFALKEAPAFASAALFASGGIYATLRHRLLKYWPELTLQVS
jgi:hypothetical protein